MLRYSVTTGLMPLKSDTGEVEARVFFMAYTLDRTGGPETRPLMFSFNGGPGSSSVWLHLGALGPQARQDARRRGDAVAALPAGGQRVHLARRHRPGVHRSGGHRLQPAGEARARQEVLGRAGRHRVGGGVHPALPHALRALGLAAVPGRRELRHHARRGPLGLPGRARASPSTASCWSPRSSTSRPRASRPGNDLPYPLFLPTYAATAWYHKKLPADLQAKPLAEFLREVEAFAAADYPDALQKGDRMSAVGAPGAW